VRRALACTLAALACAPKKTQPQPPPTPAPASSAASSAASGPGELARQFAVALASGRAPDAAALYDPKAAMTADKLGDAWKKTASGAKLDSAEIAPDPTDPAQIHVQVRLAGDKLVDGLVITRDEHVAGFHLKPLYTSPDYVDPDKFTVRTISVGEKGPLYGQLDLPNGAGPFPVVILVQGSGASDLDEWVPPEAMMIFRDLAEGLASRGVATLRFDKANWPPAGAARGFDPKTFTVKDEYLDSLGEALALVAKTPELDQKKIFVLGHSEAGWLVPWFLKDHPEIAGGIIASGCARWFGDLAVEQDQYLAITNNPTGTVKDDDLALLKAMDEQKVRNAHDPNLAADTAPELLPFGGTAAYFKFLQSYDAPSTIAKIDRPFLVLQGARDFNVTLTDLDLWKKALANNKDATFKQYDDLNHLYRHGEGKGTPKENEEPGSVARPVVDDVAGWVRSH
jgi:pimeloyl-ACP methyl ester carboxylesterase